MPFCVGATKTIYYACIQNSKEQAFSFNRMKSNSATNGNNNNKKKTRKQNENIEKWRLNHTICQRNMLCKWRFDRNEMLLNVMKLIRIAFFHRTKICLIIYPLSHTCVHASRTSHCSLEWRFIEISVRLQARLKYTHREQWFRS